MGKHAILIDDIIDTAGTITLAANALVESGAKKYMLAVHILFYQVQLLKESKIQKLKRLVITNSIALTRGKEN